MSSRGYILVETIVAMAVLSIGMLTIHNALEQAAITHAQARDMTQARFLLDEKMGEYRLRPLLDEGSEEGDFGSDNPRFHWRAAIAKVMLPSPPAPPVDPRTGAPGLAVKLPESFLVKLTVTVAWTTARRPFEESLQTLLPSTRLRKAPVIAAPANP